MNLVFLAGKAGKDAKTGNTQAGKTWASVSLATSQKKQDGTFDTTWHNVSAWSWAAQKLATVRKGDNVFVRGQIKTREYEKDGKKNKVFEILAYEIMKGEKAQAAAAVSAELDGLDSVEFTDETIPF